MPMPWGDRGGHAVRTQCRNILRGGSRSFFAASLLLPSRVRRPASALYAFCRLADDAIDLDCGGAAALADLRDRLDRAYCGRPRPSPADLAFADTVAHFAIPRALPEAMLEGFGWDAAGRRYRTLAELYGYAVRVAGSVGMMMALLMGRSEPEILARACDLGAAMQLTNIARDVGEDAHAGRLYLPLSWLRDEAIEPEVWLANPVFGEPLGRIVERLLHAADFYSTRERMRASPACRWHAGREFAPLGYSIRGSDARSKT